LDRGRSITRRSSSPCSGYGRAAEPTTDDRLRALVPEAGRLSGDHTDGVARLLGPRSRSRSRWRRRGHAPRRQPRVDDGLGQRECLRSGAGRAFHGGSFLRADRNRRGRAGLSEGGRTAARDPVDRSPPTLRQCRRVGSGGRRPRRSPTRASTDRCTRIGCADASGRPLRHDMVTDVASQPPTTAGQRGSISPTRSNRTLPDRWSDARETKTALERHRGASELSRQTPARQIEASRPPAPRASHFRRISGQRGALRLAATSRALTNVEQRPCFPPVEGLPIRGRDQPSERGWPRTGTERSFQLTGRRVRTCAEGV
jgi:hypothetical protein